MASAPVASGVVDEEKLHAFVGQVVTDFGAALSSMLTYIGQKLGLYTALRDAGSVTSEEFAKRTGRPNRQRLE